MDNIFWKNPPAKTCLYARTRNYRGNLQDKNPGYLSPAPQAEPQAAGFSSGLSPEPQAEPQAAGFSSGLSPEPQAEPQAAAGADSVLLFQPKRFESAIIVTS